MADQRIFMSATLGAGGDLERLTGRRSIDRLPAPEGFQNAGVGRRFFIFPSLSLSDEDINSLRIDMQQRAGRSVILTPSTDQAAAHQNQIDSNLQGFKVFTKDNIEKNRKPFVESENAVAILANRYDGIDFPGDECRLLCIDGLPKATNMQERFVMSKMGASALYNERIQTRVLQAAGRCTRALQDRSTVFVTGIELVDFLADSRKWQYFHPELQAELSFGVDQSEEVSCENIFENFDMFMKNDDGWSSADGIIRNAIADKERVEFPAMNELQTVVRSEVAYQEAMWNKDYAKALTAAREILGGIIHTDLRGYRALWHYLAGSAALRLSTDPGDPQAIAAKKQFARAKDAAPAVSWLNSLARAVGGIESDEASIQSAETLKQVEALELQFLTMGTATNHKFEKLVARVQKELANPNTFESAQLELGKLLGFNAGNNNGDAAPDPWWLGLGGTLGIVFEDHADGKATSVLGATKARQASSHPKWINQNLPGAINMKISTVLVTPCTKVNSGAVPHLDEVYFWALDEFRTWTISAIGVLRSLKGEFPGEGDVVWRAEAAQRLVAEGLTLETILQKRPMATDAMEVVQ